MHVHRAGPLHPNQYHTLSQKTDPTLYLGALHLVNRTNETAAHGGGGDGGVSDGDGDTNNIGDDGLDDERGSAST